MATSVTILPYLSPRLIVVPVTDTEITIQEIVDLVRDWEDSEEGMAYPYIIDAAGKEDLGGGVQVGLTCTLQNAQIAFAARTTELTEGTVTATGSNTSLVAAGDTFQSDGVSRGDLVFNTTDSSQASVVEVISQFEIEVDGLTGGNDNTFQLNDQYIIWDVVQCNISGGNLVAVDDVGDNIDPVFTTFGTQVVRTSSSSATLQSQTQLEHSTYNEGVTLDVANGTSGTTYPIGTPETPVNNLVDAMAIADARGFINIYIRGNLTITSETVTNGYALIGQSRDLTKITIQDPATISSVTLQKATVTGFLDGSSVIVDCDVENLDYFSGKIRNSGLKGTITLGGGVKASFVNCWSEVPGSLTPTIDLNGGGNDFLMRGYAGGIKVVNCNTGGADVSIDMNSGQVIFDATVSAGTYTVRGVATLRDYSTGTAVVNNELFGGLLKGISFNGEVYIDPISGTNDTRFPVGTKETPVNSIANALVIAADAGITNLVLVGNVTVSASDDISGYTLIGDNALKSSVTLNPGCTTTFTQFIELTITGTANGSIIVRDSRVNNLNDIEGILHTCLLSNTLTFAGSNRTQILNCYGSDAAGSEPAFDMSGATVGIDINGFSGNLRFANLSTNLQTKIAISEGHVVLDNTVTAGTFEINGNAYLENNSTGTTVNLNGLINEQVRLIQVDVTNIFNVVTEIRKYHKNRQLIDENNYTLTIFDDNGTTPLHVFDLKDENGVASITQILERVPQ